MLSFCLRRRAQSEPSNTISSPTTAANLDPLELLPWAIGIARGVREDARFRAGSAEEEELEGVATVALIELLHRFDELRVPPPHQGGDIRGAFKGFATVEIRSRCRRQAEQLRNGGLYRTTSDPGMRGLRVSALPQSEDDGEILLAWPEREEELEDVS